MSADLPQNPRWFTIRDAARYLQVGEPTIYRWMRDGKITFRKIGDSTRFLEEDLQALIVVHSTKGRAPLKGGCPCCGSGNLVDGKCQSTGALYFIPEDAKFWTLKTSTVGLSSRMCADCGHIILKGDHEHLSELLKKAKKKTEAEK